MLSERYLMQQREKRNKMNRNSRRRMLQRRPRPQPK
jgi:hypothetical protein